MKKIKRIISKEFIKALKDADKALSKADDKLQKLSTVKQ